MAVYKPYKKTSNGKEEIKIPYSSINGTPTIPTVNDGTLTIQKNGTTVKTFSANQSGNITANITVPTKVSELENDSEFTKNTGTVTSVAVKMNGAEKGKVTSSGTIDLGTVLTDASKFATSAQGTKADNAMPKAGGAFTGAVTVQAPTENMSPATKQYVDTAINAVKQFEYQVVTELPTAAQATMGKIYLIAHSHNPSDGKPDSYDEFITVQSGSTYKWERIGNTDIDLSGYVPTTRKINNRALSSDINLGASDVGVTEAAFPGLNKTGTVTAVKINGATKNPASGVVDLGTFLTAQDISGKANLDGGNTFKGKQTFTDPPIDNPYSIDASGYVRGSLLQSSAVAKKDTNADKVCVFISGGFIYYRTPAEIVSDGGGATTDQIHNGTLTIQKNGTKVQTFSANQSGNVTANITVPTKVSELENDSGFTSNAGTVTSVAVKMNGKEKGKVTSSGTIDLGTVLTNDGGTINKSKTVKMDASANSDGANLKWGTVNSKNPYIGYASDQADGTFVVGSLLGTNYASGLAIGGGSGNLLWKGTKVATTSDIPTFHLYEHSIYLYAHKTSGIYFDVYFTIITNSAASITYANLGTMYKNVSISATGDGNAPDPEGTTTQFPASVTRIYHDGTYLLIDSVYNNLNITPIISNGTSAAYFSSSDVTITDKVRTIL